MLGFLYKKTPSWSANAAATASLAVVLACNTVIDVRPYQYEVNIFGGILVSALVFFLSALWPEKDPRAIERIDAFAADAVFGSAWTPNLPTASICPAFHS